MTFDLTEQIRKWTDQLHTDRIHYLQTEILLSSLEEMVNSGQFTDATTSKIKTVLHFGDLNEYLNVQETESDIPLGVGKLMGILTNAEHDQSVKLTEAEKQIVLDNLAKHLTQKNLLLYEIFSGHLQSGSRAASEENLMKLVDCLKAAVNSTIVWDQHKNIVSDVNKCYEELGKGQTMLKSLVEMKLNPGEPLYGSVKKLNVLNAQATEAKSKELLGDLKNELLSDDGAAALEIIHSKQREEMERMKLDLKRIREEVLQYEKMRSEGFDDLLKEYLDISCRRKEKEKLREDYVKGFEITQDSDAH